jgi:hypothetical protein
MSVSMTKEFFGNVISLSDCKKFEMIVSQSGSDRTEGWFEIQESGSGDTLVRRSYRRPGTIPLLMNEQLSWLLNTPFPGPGTTAQQLSGSWLEFQVLFGEKTVDDECNVTESTSGVLSSLVALNAKSQNHDDIDFDEPQILTRRPLRYSICEGQPDWLCVWTGDSGGIEVHVTYKPSKNPGTWVTYGYSSLQAKKVYAIPTNIDLVAVPGSTIDIQVSGEIKQTYGVLVEACCCSGDYAEVAFLENLGGWSVMSFNCVDQAGARRATKRRCITDACSSNVINRTRVLDNGSKPVITLKKVLDNSEAVIDWMNEFFTSRKHLLRIAKLDKGGSPIWKWGAYTISDGSYVYHDNDQFVEFTVEMEPESYNIL